MRIVFCNTIGSWGGGEKWHYETACELADQGHSVYFLLHPHGSIKQKLVDKSVQILECRIGNLSFLNPAKFFKLFLKLKSIHADAILINRPAELKIVAFVAKSVGIKHIVYRRGSDVVVKKSKLNTLLLEKIVDQIIANSTSTKRSLLKSGLAIEKKIRVIHNGIKQSMPDALFSRKQSDIKIIGAAGRLVNQKGFDMLLLVAAQLKERGLRFRIEIAGEGPERSSLELKIDELGLSSHVNLKGFVNDMPSFFEACDVFVLPSRYEGFGYVMVEAMLAQKPVIAFKTSSATDIVSDNVTGFLVDAFDLSQFADKIETLITKGDLAISMGQKGYQRALERFPLKKATEELIACLSE